MTHKLQYNWEAIQQYYDEGHSVRECMKHFGFGWTAYHKAVKSGRLKTRDYQSAIKLRKPAKQCWSKASRLKMREYALKRGLGGKRNSHRQEYNGVIFDSTYELRVAKVLDRDSIKWEKADIRFEWFDEKGKSHKYRPDFWLPDHQVYLDPKNSYLTIKDTPKIEQVRKKHLVVVHIIPINMIEKWEQTKFSI